ncbi:MAG: DUF4345 family protein [Alphaproteobacteria bacterium]|nr:DUF4345 family protein [Alphaproteobacteria bacterium]
MKILMRVLVLLVAAFNILMGVGFLLQPARLAQGFFLTPEGAQGLATLRADFSAFFLVGGAFAAYGAWRARGGPLVVPIALLGVALSGRCVSLALDGMAPGAYVPMAIEAVMITLLLAARSVFGKR